MWLFNSRVRIASAKNLNQAHISCMILNYPRPSDGSFKQLWDSKCNFSILVSIPIRNTPVLDVVWLPDRQVIFSTPPKRRFSVLFRAKRTSDSSSAPQNFLESIYSSLSGHLSSQETSKQPSCTRCHVRNVFFRTRLLPYVLYGDFREGKFDVCYLQNHWTKFSRTKFT